MIDSYAGEGDESDTEWERELVPREEKSHHHEWE